ncbi:MAG: Uma2 family endonuclease [Lachnospiraceae bacterium]|nr:Uma2 family endonuclease [Lachnospiraceae bacterium]
MNEIYTVEGVVNMGEVHAELIAGQLVITDRTTTNHNSVVLDLCVEFKNFINLNKGTCKVFSENAALFCNELSEEASKEFYLPDLMVVCDEAGIKDDGVHTAPLFVAEVTSDSTRRFDYGEKMVTYGNIGVKEYWVVDLQKNAVTKYLLDNDYALITYLHPEKVEASAYDGKLIIDFSEILPQ